MSDTITIGYDDGDLDAPYAPPAKRGIVIGKFMPFHSGHEYLISVAEADCDEVFVLLYTNRDEPINGSDRYFWLKNFYADHEKVFVYHSQDRNPLLPEDHTFFWEIWEHSIKRIVGECDKNDTLYTSELYGDKLASYLGTKHVCVDLNREAYKVSGSQIRAIPENNKRYLKGNNKQPIQAKFLTKKIAIVGTESTGKTTLANELTEHYRKDGFIVEMVEEYGRAYIEINPEKKKNLTLEDISNIASGQLMLEQRVLEKNPFAPDIIFYDTELITTQIFSELYCDGKVPRWLLEHNDRNRYDHYIVCASDIPFEDDGSGRITEYIRFEHETMILRELKARGIKGHIISGSGKDRTESAISVVDELLEIQK